MKTLTVALPGREYDIVIRRGLLAQAGERIRAVLPCASKLAVVTDSHVEPLAMAAIAAGADGLIIEVHNDPPHAKCDGQQSLTPESFQSLMAKVRALVPMAGKVLV